MDVNVNKQKEHKMSEEQKIPKKRGRKPKILGNVDVMIPTEPKQPKHKNYKKIPKEVYDAAAKKAVDKVVKAQLIDKIEIDWEQFEKLCGYQCTQEEIADFFRCETHELAQVCQRKYKRPFEKVYKIFSAPGLCSLRRSQFVLAKNNSQMAIWLGKIYLNQIDPAQKKVEETVDRLSTILDQIDEETKKIIAQKDEITHSVF